MAHDTATIIVTLLMVTFGVVLVRLLWREYWKPQHLVTGAERTASYMTIAVIGLSFQFWLILFILLGMRP